MNPIPSAIRAEIEDWITQGVVKDLSDINDGLCDEFAEAVVRRIKVTNHDVAIMIRFAFTDDWWVRNPRKEADAFVADIPRLRAEEAPLPEGFSDRELGLLIGAMTHAWIIHDGRHYDATAPDGANHFLQMPFFADQIAEATLDDIIAA